MEASNLLGLWARAGRLVVAIALSLSFFAVTHPGVGHAATKRAPVASAAALRAELTTVDHRRAALRTAIKRSCRKQDRSKTCRTRRASLARAEARAAQLRKALRRTPAPKATPKASAPSAPIADESRASTGGPAQSTTTSGGPTTSSAVAAAALPTISDAPVHYQPGVVAWSDPHYDIPAADRLGARHVRLEFPINATVADLAPTIGSWAAHGVQVLILASFNHRVPSSDEARSLAAWAAAFGPGGTYWTTHPGGASAPALIEFGNETYGWWQYGDSPDAASYGQRARTYALRFKEAALAVAQANRHVGVLAQGDDPSGRWIDAMYAAVPNLHEYVSGWTAHPYGDNWRAELRANRNRLGAHGAPASIPWDVTETGLAVDDGRCVDDNYGWDRCMTYATAATTLRGIVSQLRADLGDRLRSLDLYRVRDLRMPGDTSAREDYFGLQTLDLQDKGPFTAQARTELAQGF